MGRVITLTAKQCDGQDYSIPRVVYLQEDAISVDLARNAGTGKYTRVVEKLGNRTRQYQTYEKAMQIEAQRNPASTDLLVKQQIAVGLAGAGAAQGAATALTKYFNEVTTGTAGSADGVRLPAATVGKVIVVLNNHATAAINVYPATGEFIGAALVNVALAVVAGDRVHFACAVAGKWQVAIDRGK